MAVLPKSRLLEPCYNLSLRMFMHSKHSQYFGEVHMAMHRICPSSTWCILFIISDQVKGHHFGTAGVDVPPSMTTSLPVIQGVLRSEQSRTARSPISFGSANLRSGY